LCSSLGADAHVRRRLKAISPNRVWDAPLEEGKSLGGLQALAQNLPRRSFVFVAHHAFARPDSCRHEAMRNLACRYASPSCIRRAEGMESFKATVHLQAARRINSSSKIKASKALSKATQQVSIRNGSRLGPTVQDPILPNCARSTRARPAASRAQESRWHICTVADVHAATRFRHGRVASIAQPSMIAITCRQPACAGTDRARRHAVHTTAVPGCAKSMPAHTLAAPRT